MIPNTITFVTIATLQLVLVSFTMDIYGTDAAIWSQTETTTDQQDHYIGTGYQQIAATSTPEMSIDLATTFRSKLNVSLVNLVSAFNTSSYVGDCSDLQEHTAADELQIIPYDREFTHELVRTAWELNAEFNTLKKTALLFICTKDTTLRHNVISMSRRYVQNFTEFMVRLNNSAAELGEVAVLDNVGELYSNSVQRVELVMELVEYLTEIISEEEKLDAMKRSILQEMEEMYFLNKSSVWEITVGKQKELVNLLKHVFKMAGNMSEHKEGNPFINAITSSNISRFLDVEYMAKLLEEETQVFVQYQTELRGALHDQFVIYTVRPVIMAIVLVVGLTGNGLLLTIFVRHKETRTPANSMLINLTVLDCVSLVLNLVLEYVRITTPWQFGLLGCKLYFFFRYVFVAVSTYSVAMLSVQRFVAVRQLPSLAWWHQSNKIKYVLIATVWVLGFILSVPHAVIADMKKALCFELSRDKFGPVSTADLFALCVVPLLITAVFSGLTAYRIRRSIRRIPGEATGKEQMKHDRMVSSTVLVALTVLFVVSYMPDFLFKFLTIQMGIHVPNWEFILVNVITYFLRFVNCCLNPIVLFVMSKRYRGYIKRYCGQREVQPVSNSGSSMETSL
jgi:gastrin-releasing peptide receptor